MAETTKQAWVTIPSEEEARPILGGMPYDFGFIPGMGRLLMAHPQMGPAFYQLYSTIMFAPEGALDRQEREMVAAVASAAQDCHY